MNYGEEQIELAIYLLRSIDHQLKGFLQYFSFSRYASLVTQPRPVEGSHPR